MLIKWTTDNPIVQREMLLIRYSNHLTDLNDHLVVLKKAIKELHLEIADTEKRIMDLEVKKWKLETYQDV